MHLTPELIANILLRQKVLTREQAQEIKKEVRMMPRQLPGVTWSYLMIW